MFAGMSIRAPRIKLQLSQDRQLNRCRKKGTELTKVHLSVDNSYALLTPFMLFFLFSLMH